MLLNLLWTFYLKILKKKDIFFHKNIDKSAPNQHIILETDVSQNQAWSMKLYKYKKDGWIYEVK